MKPVQRSEILEIGAYEDIRERFRARIIAEKKRRRFSPSPELSVVFENRDTVLFQVQEMLRTERITKESGVLHELETYNELVPAADELSATLFVEIADKDTRDARLQELAGLEHQFGFELAGRYFPARNETRGLLPDRTTAVHYLKIAVGSEGVAALVSAARGPATGESTEVFFVSRHPRLSIRTALPVEVVRALAEDFLEA